LATLDFEMRVGGSALRREGDVVKLLVMGDFSGRAHRGLMDVSTLAKRRAVPVDIDSLDAVVARFAPRLAATLDDGTAADLDITCIDDLHPDRLIALHSPLAALMTLRERVLDPAQFAIAAAELGGARGDTKAQTPEDDRATIGRLLGDSPATGSARPASAAAIAVAALIRQISAGPASAPGAPEFQPQYLAAVDALTTAKLRALLHLPAFQSLEAAWRGVQMLVSRLDLGDELQLHLLDVTLDELRTDAAQAAGDPSQSALARRLRSLADEAAEADASWLIAGGLFNFAADDLDVLASIGDAARAIAVPFIAGADATIAGTFPDASEWQPPAEATLARWRALRAGTSASAIGLVVPRFLLRLPYGRATDAIDAFPFEELAKPVPSSAELLWGHAALAAMLVRARDAETNAFDIDDLPALTYDEDGERRLCCCAEWLIGERIADRLADHGMMPLLGSRQRNAVRLVGWRAVAAG